MEGKAVVDSKNGDAVAARDVWVSGMRQAGLSEKEINRVVEATATLARPENGDGELVPVKEAAQRIGRSENTVRSWIRLGHLDTVEFTPPPDHPNGPWVHVDMADVEELNSDSGPEPAEDGLLTLREAAQRFGITWVRVRSWVYRGRLKPTKRRNDGAILVDPAAVQALLSTPPRRPGGPGRATPIDKPATPDI